MKLGGAAGVVTKVPMIIPRVRRALGFMRVAQLPGLARRILGFRHVQITDFLPDQSPEDLARLRAITERVRFRDQVRRAPAILVFGVLPRSGTNYVRDVLALHPDVRADAGRLYEFPLLDAMDAFGAAQAEFIEIYPRNAEVMHPNELGAILAAAWIGDLQRSAGEGERILLKNPHVRNLTLATTLFPGDKIVLVLRDGRDVVDSSLKTFGGSSLLRKSFGQLAWEWRCAAEAILSFCNEGSSQHPDVMVLRYEDLMTETDATLSQLLRHVALDEARFDRGAFDALPVRGSSRSGLSADDRWRPEERDKNFNPLQRWRSWNNRRKAAFDRIAGDVLTRAGYPPTF